MAMIVETEIKRWGNSLALRVSGLMAELPGFTEGMKVSVTVTEEGLVVKPVPLEVREGALPYSEKQLLRGLDADTAHADELAEPTSRELGE